MADLLTSVKRFHDFNSNRLRFISGKWFNEDEEEIPNIKKEVAINLIENDDYSLFFKGIKNMCDVENWIDCYKDLYGESSFWFPSKFIKKAIDYPKVELSDLPFPFDYKQIVIINRLLFHPEDEVVFITTGVGGSGKSTFLNIVKQLFANDYSSASLSDLSVGFRLAEATQKRLICSDELAKGELNLPVLKQLASKQHIMVEPKYLTPYEMQSQSALFYCCNKAPKIDVTDTGILRRIVFYERNTPISNPNPLLNRKEFTEDELLKIAAYAYQQDTSNWRDLFKEETHKYLMQNNSVYLYMLLHNGNVYDDYVEFCRNKNYKAYNEINYNDIYDLFSSWNEELQSSRGEDVF